MTFDEYARSLECVTVSHLPESDRLRDAYAVGSGGKAPPPLLVFVNYPYRWDRIEAAFEMGRSGR